MAKPVDNGSVFVYSLISVWFLSTPIHTFLAIMAKSICKRFRLQMDSFFGQKSKHMACFQRWTLPVDLLCTCSRRRNHLLLSSFSMPTRLCFDSLGRSSTVATVNAQKTEDTIQKWPLCLLILPAHLRIKRQ